MIEELLIINELLLFFIAGCWVAWEAGTCRRVGVAVARWCVQVRASQDTVDRLPPETRAMLRYHRIYRNMPPEGAGLLPPAITRVAPLSIAVSNSVISCEFIFFFWIKFSNVDEWFLRKWQNYDWNGHIPIWYLYPFLLDNVGNLFRVIIRYHSCR